jgi:hypothetical protein
MFTQTEGGIMDEENSLIHRFWAIMIREFDEFVDQQLILLKAEEGNDGQKGNVFTMPQERPHSFTSLDPQE